MGDDYDLTSLLWEVSFEIQRKERNIDWQLDPRLLRWIFFFYPVSEKQLFRVSLTLVKIKTLNLRRDLTTIDWGQFPKQNVDTFFYEPVSNTYNK